MSRRLRKMRLSRARARAENRPEKFAEKASDLGALQKSVEDAAAVRIGFWLSYLFTLFYLGIAVAGVTHRDLLLENPVKLPFLNTLSLVGFFLVAPMLFLVIHAYALVHFVMLAVKHLGDEGVYGAGKRETAGSTDRTEVFLNITRIVRLADPRRRASG